MFADDLYYEYDSANDRVIKGWPRKIKDDFKPKVNQSYTMVMDSSGNVTNVTNQVPDNLDSVYFDTRDRNIYFFKGEWVCDL